MRMWRIIALVACLFVSGCYGTGYVAGYGDARAPYYRAPYGSYYGGYRRPTYGYYRPYGPYYHPYGRGTPYYPHRYPPYYR